MLTIIDLNQNTEMGRQEMATVRGGNSPFTIDFGTRMDSRVADVTQAFDFSLAQGNEGAVTNNQEIFGGNGSSWSPVTQDQYQDNWLDLSHIGNTSVGESR